MEEWLIAKCKSSIKNHFYSNNSHNSAKYLLFVYLNSAHGFVKISFPLIQLDVGFSGRNTIFIHYSEARNGLHFISEMNILKALGDTQHIIPWNDANFLSFIRLGQVIGPKRVKAFKAGNVHVS